MATYPNNSGAAGLFILWLGVAQFAFALLCLLVRQELAAEPAVDELVMPRIIRATIAGALLAALGALLIAQAEVPDAVIIAWLAVLVIGAARRSGCGRPGTGAGAPPDRHGQAEHARRGVVQQHQGLRKGHHRHPGMGAHGFLAWNTLDRSCTAASRALSGRRWKRRSMVARTEVVSCWVWSTTNPPRRNGEITRAGMRVPGPKASWGPRRPSWPGGVTWSHWPPNSS